MTQDDHELIVETVRFMDRIQKIQSTSSEHVLRKGWIVIASIWRQYGYCGMEYMMEIDRMHTSKKTIMVDFDQYAEELMVEVRFQRVCVIE